MTKKELVEILQPLIKRLVKESVREILLEGGMLSKIISEVATGLASVKSEVRTPPQPRQVSDERVMERLEEQRKQRRKLLDSIGIGDKNGLNPFTGTTPLHESKSDHGVPSPLANVAPDDPGVDIDKLLGGMKFDFGGKKTKLG